MNLARAALEFLKLDSQYNDALVACRADLTNDDLYRKAHHLGEERETARRMLADMVILNEPSLKSAVREVVKFSLADMSKTGMVGQAPTNTH